MSTCPPSNCFCNDNPLTGFFSEARDLMTPLATAYVSVLPPLGSDWCAWECAAFANNLILPAPGSSGGGGGEGGGIIPGPSAFLNVSQSCTFICPDGTPFIFNVNAGAFRGATQAAADAAAEAYACDQASKRAVCLSASLPVGIIAFAYNGGANTALPWFPYAGTITATGGTLATGSQTNLWEIVSGGLPPGLTFNGGQLASDSVTITGTPTTLGIYTFIVRCTTPTGDTNTGTFKINIGGKVRAIDFISTGYRNNPGTVNTVCEVGSPAAGYNPYSPAAPYTGGWQDFPIPANGQLWVQTLEFTSMTPVTWSWRFSGSGGVATTSDPAHQFCQLSLTTPQWACGGVSPGVVQNPTVQADGTWNQTGTFATDAGTQVDAHYGQGRNIAFPTGGCAFDFFITA
jgi:hypothetical protein